MAVKYGKRKNRKNNVLYTVIATVLLCAVFLTMVGYFYTNAEEEAYEQLHVQTKQIKDDMQLQLLSDRENLVTMASFAAKLYSDGESYELLFESFEPIGLIDNVGILNPDNTFVTKVGSVNLDGLISFEEEKARGEYISGRVKDLTTDRHEIIRSAVPVKVDGNTVGILYGVINLDTIGKRYGQMAEELDAQLFVYDKDSGNLVIDTISKTLGNISFLKDREYNEGYSYEQMRESDKGFTSFVSAYTGEDLYVHYSTLDDIGWRITLARYESQVFAKTDAVSRVLVISFSAMVVIMFLYTLIIVNSEKHRRAVMSCASNVRKLLLEINQEHHNVEKALKQISLLASSRSAVLFDTDGKEYNYIVPSMEKVILEEKSREHFRLELLRCATEFYAANDAPVNVMSVALGADLKKTNSEFYAFMKKHGIREIIFATVIDENNRKSILCAVNPKRRRMTRTLLEDVAVCFSIALYNKKYLNETETAVITDSLTGALNRVAYKRDLLEIDKEKAQEFSCIYVDVNELHIRNNKLGHAAGDEMLLYISNTLKEVFYGHRIYRMGGDEFLVFAQNMEQEAVKKNIELFIEQLKPMDYHVAIGMSYRTQNTNTEEMVREAEIRMYEAKAKYYQDKEQQRVSKPDDKGYIQVKTGILEIDAMISVLKENYNGIYRVSLDADKAYRILMPAYLGYNETEEHFSTLLNKYIYETVSPDFHRAVMSFLNYDALRQQMLEGKVPKITYKKTDGSVVMLSVYRIDESDKHADNTLWVFSKAEIV